MDRFPADGAVGIPSRIAAVFGEASEAWLTERVLTGIARVRIVEHIQTDGTNNVAVFKYVDGRFLFKSCQKFSILKKNDKINVNSIFTIIPDNLFTV